MQKASRERRSAFDAGSESQPDTVIAGLDPAIHAVSFPRTRYLPTGNGVDARVKPGHDGERGHEPHHPLCVIPRLDRGTRHQRALGKPLSQCRAASGPPVSAFRLAGG